MASASTSRFKVVLLGEGRVGKTSLLLRYVKDTFDDRQVSTIQASYLEKRLNLGNRTVNLAIWDTAGQERFHALGPIYYRDANGALLVYDITDKESFTKVKNWVKELRKIVGDDIELCIAGNKCDLEKQRQVPEDEAEAYAVSVGATHYKVSAKNGRGVEDVFLQMSRTMVDKQSSKAGASAAGAAGRRKGRDVVTVVDEPSDDQAKSGGCC